MKSSFLPFIPAWVVLLGLFLPSCGENDSPQEQPGQIAEPAQGMWVTLGMEDEEFRAVVTKHDEIIQVLTWARQGTQPQAISGEVREGGEFNSPYSWHLEPETLRFESRVVPDVCSTPPSVFESEESWRECEIYARDSIEILAVQDCRGARCEPLLTGAPPRPTPDPSPTPEPEITGYNMNGDLTHCIPQGAGNPCPAIFPEFAMNCQNNGHEVLRCESCTFLCSEQI